jgi:hypothetical protein
MVFSPVLWKKLLSPVALAKFLLTGTTLPHSLVIRLSKKLSKIILLLSFPVISG